MIIYETSKIPQRSPKDRLGNLTKSNVIYNFTCSCSADYVGKTSRRLEERIKEHIPKWLAEGKQGPPRSRSAPQSAITRHLQRCRPTAANAQNFKVIETSNTSRRLGFLEAVTILIRQPKLCMQNDFVTQLCLSWRTAVLKRWYRV